MLGKKLQDMLIHSVGTVPYYKALFKKYSIDLPDIKDKKGLERIPVLTKNIIQKNLDDFLSSDYLRYPKRADLMTHSTSGSSGMCMQIQWSKTDYLRSMFTLWMIRKKVYGIDTNDKLLSFHTNIFSSSVLVNNEQKILLNDRVLSLSNLCSNENQIEFFYSEMMNFNSVWISAQPSTVYLLADYMKMNNKKAPESLKYIELTGEYLFDSTLRRIKEAFKGVCIANMYGMVEANGIACQCKNGNLHVLEPNVLVEILDSEAKPVNEGKEGEIYITSLTNTAMPLIRYSTGDRGILYDIFNCPCGNKSPVLDVKAGRVSELADTEDGKRLTPHIFSYPIKIINDEMSNPIKQFQIIQNDINDFTVILVLEITFNGWDNSIKEYYCKLMKDTCLKSARWDFIFRDNIYPDDISGKYKLFINKTDKKGRIFT